MKPWILCCALAPLSSCALLGESDAISFSSDPPGATVLVDGRDSGFVTPCMIDLDPDEATRIEIAREGYVTAARMLVPDTYVHSVLWREMNVRPGVWRFPLWFSMRDFFVPIKVEESLSPSRVHVRLERVSDEPLERTAQ